MTCLPPSTSHTRAWRGAASWACSRSCSPTASAAEYTKFMDDSKLSSEVKKTEVKGKTDLKTRTDSQASTAKSDLASSNEQLTAAMKYYDELKPSCVDAGLDYDERTARRNEEVESLK